MRLGAVVALNRCRLRMSPDHPEPDRQKSSAWAQPRLWPCSKLGRASIFAMSILKVAKLGNPVLRQIAKPVPAGAIRSHEIQRLIKDMVTTMREYGGVGLAAPQVHESVQIAVVEGLEDAGPGKRQPTQLQILINPALTVLY